ncbi:MAG: DNA primase [Muribaculaceae bacterium]|nr:DNA primase [Muribaculaceae bacterium]
MIDKATVQRIKDVADIVEVVSDYVHLTRRGSNYMGLCPFHNERTPSFSVNKRRNFCYCFSCHKGGSPVNFIMEKEGVSYHEALLHLAKKYGIKVEERELTDEERKVQSEREGLLVAADNAMHKMERDLHDTPEGRDVGLSYLYSRGVTEEAIRKFHLGYAIDKGDYLTSAMLREGFEEDTLRALGVTGKSQSGHLYDKYRGRVIFPIMNSSGKVVGFGGRDLKGGPAKYINSPESVLYHKNNELYGIFQAKSEIVRQDKCFLVEGYLDVIGMWQSGMQNVVASSGTALTDGQIALIHRFTNNITLLYDGDKAGIKAALRGIDMLLSHKMKVTVLLLPDGDDPDSFARKHTPEEFREYIARHETDIIRFKMQVLMDEAGDDPQKKAGVVNSVVESIASIPNDVERMVYIGECSRIMKIDDAAVANAVERARIAIIDRQIAERRARKAEKDFPANNQINDKTDSNAVSPSSDNSSENNEGTRQWMKVLQSSSEKNHYPLYPLERNVIEQLVKNGYLNFVYDATAGSSDDSVDNHASVESEVSEEIYTNVDFVQEELEADKIDFSVPVFKRVFDFLYDTIDQFIEELPQFEARLQEKIVSERESGRMEIANRYTTIQEIEREEKLLEERLGVMKRNEIMDYARYYPGDLLASHEDDEMRKLANELINEKYKLSGIFTKNLAAPKESEISASIIRAITEWKSEILNLELKDVMERFRNEGGKDEEEDIRTLNKINHLMMMRSKVAKNIGDRIISPRRK